MISENKIKHILSVARRCRELAEEYDLSKEEQDACFVMGFLHDIGYENLSKGEDISTHGAVGCEMLSHFLDFQEPIMDAIRFHGKKTDNLSVFDIILNKADLTIDYQGNEIPVQKRLDDIQKHHGENSVHYLHAKQQAEALGMIGIEEIER